MLIRTWLDRTGRQAPAVLAVFAATASVLAANSPPANAAVPSGAATPHPRTLYVTSTDAGKVRALSIGPQGTLTELGEPVPAGPDARAVVLTPDGRFAYVGGQGTGDISEYAVQPSGALTRLAEQPFPTDGSPFGMAMAPGGRVLYATDQANDQVSAFAIGTGGRLSKLGSVPSGGTNPRGLAVTPDGRHVYATNGSRDTTVENTLVAFSVRADGSLDNASPGRVIGLGKGTFLSQIAITPDGRLLYAASQAGNVVWGFRAGTDGSLSKVPYSPFPAPNAPEGITLAPGGRHLYTASVEGDLNPDGANAVGAFRIRDDGGLTAAHKPVMEGDGPVAITPSPDGRHLFAPNTDSSDVSSFEVVAGTGALRRITGSPFKLDPDFTTPAFQSVAVAPNQGPAARFSAIRRPDGRTADFDASGSSDPDGHVAHFDWDFGDGTVLADGGATPTHHYTRPGTFTTRLTITDHEGCSDKLVFTGQSALCNGTAAAHFHLPILVGR